MRARSLSTVVIGASAIIAGLIAGPVQAATDTTPPVWSKPPTNAITLGARLDPAVLADSCDSWNLPVKISWAAQDSQSGIDHYGYSGYDNGSEDATITSNTSLTLTSWVEDDICGGGGSDENFYAWNGAGLHAAWGWHDEGLGVIQDDRFDGSNCDSETGLNCITQGTYMTYNGTWGTSAANAFSGGTTHKTTQSGASATLHIEPADSGPFGYNVSYGVGLLMAKAPDRGKAAVFVDGVKVATIDTYSATKVNRTVVWRQTLTGDEWHTVKVVNLATSRRTRVDVDAFILLQKVPGGALDPALY